MSGSNVSWERFEEQTKLAFVGNPLNSRLFLKTRVMATKDVKVVARVSHRSAKLTSASRSGAVKYATTDTTNLFRLTRLLRFIMQEVLGPMKALPASMTTPLSSVSEPTTTPVCASQADKKKKSKKKKKKAKK